MSTSGQSIWGQEYRQRFSRIFPKTNKVIKSVILLPENLTAETNHALRTVEELSKDILGI